MYDLHGSLFFASTQNFIALFSPQDDPVEVVIDFKNARVKDHSALEAIDLLAARYAQRGKKLHLRHLSPDCLELLNKAKGMIEVNVLEDPLYHPADNRLG
nr:hypothetical protein [Ferrovum myxofaciens]